MYSSYSPCKEVTDALQQQLISHFLHTQSRKTKKTSGSKSLISSSPTAHCTTAVNARRQQEAELDLKQSISLYSSPQSWKVLLSE